MNQTTQNILYEEGILFPTGELHRNKLNLMSGSTIQLICDMFWEASIRDKELCLKENWNGAASSKKSINTLRFVSPEIYYTYEDH